MITIELEDIEYYDDSNNEFIYDRGGTVRFEYSLKVVYDWEDKYRKPFLKGEFELEELDDFYMMMALDPIEERFMTDEVKNKLADYVKDPGTATTFSAGQNSNNSSSGKVYTAEEIYALMFSAGVDISFENRNLNRLLVTLRIIATFNNPPKKMDRQEVLKQNSNLNRQRKAQMNTRG